MELWKRVYINNEQTVYEISNYGRCRHIEKLDWKTKGILKPKINKKSNYCQYCLVHNGKNHYRYIHRIVAESFVEGNKGLEVNHKDGDKKNNIFTNLEWVTKKENMRHCFDTGLSSVNKPVKQYTLQGEYIATFRSASEAERETGVNGRTISAALNKKYVSAGGYQWQFQNDESALEDVSGFAKKMNLRIVQLTLEGEFVEEFSKMNDAYKKLGKTDNGVISQVCKGNRKKYMGFKWMYASEYYNIVDEEIVYAHSQ